MISLTINGQIVETQEGATILQAAEAAGILIPTLCYHKDLSPYGGCRLCMVEIKGNRLPSTSCNMLASPGMEVQTESPDLTHYRRSVLSMLLRNFYDGGYKHANGTAALDEDTQFAHWVSVYGIDMKSAMAQHPLFPIDSDPNPYVWVDRNKCILCTRCVRACAEVQGRFVWEQAYRGYQASLVAGAGTSMLQGRCESCGACVAYCPTGALDNKMSISLGKADRSVVTTCGYCSIGCQFILETRKGKVIRVVSDPDAPVNGMHLCVKGRYGYDFIQRSGRLLRPRVRKYLLKEAQRPEKRGPWVEVDWETALDVVARRLMAIKSSDGPQSIGLFTSGLATNEENYLMNKFTRGVIGTNNIDLCAHLHVTSTVAGLDKPDGSNWRPVSMDQIANQARSILIIGSNITEQNPVLGAKIRQAVLRRAVKVVVAAPSFINIEEYAALNLRIAPATEAALVNGLACIIMEKGWEERQFVGEHTRGYEAFKAGIQAFTPDSVAKATGVSLEDLYLAAEILALHHPMALIWGSGIAGHETGAKTVRAMANLQMLLGNVHVPGGGLLPLRSQANSQGACDMGGIPDYLPGYQSISDEKARQKFETAWQTKLPPQPGLTAAEMLAAASQGTLKGVYILGEDLVQGENSLSVRSALQNADFIVFQGAFPSQMSACADVLLPGVTMAEKTGTFTNTEGRIQMIRQAISPIGDSRPDWWIIRELATRILEAEGGLPDGQPSAGWGYNHPSEIMDEAAGLAPIYSGVSHQRLEQGDDLVWPAEKQTSVESIDLAADSALQAKPPFLPFFDV